MLYTNPICRQYVVQKKVNIKGFIQSFFLLHVFQEKNKNKSLIHNQYFSFMKSKGYFVY